ncbi:MAG: TolC family protein [Burkholderiaceae bacterium]
MRRSAALRQALAIGLALACSGTTFAQAAPTSERGGLRRAFEAAWARQPEAQSLASRAEAARAQMDAAGLWNAGAPALEIAATSDRLLRNQGAREYEVGLSVPLWLPGEKDRSAALAEAELNALDSRSRAARLRVAAEVRTAWWNWQRARSDTAMAHDQAENARRLAADVARRASAGDLARADQHQADGALASAESNLARAQAELASTAQAFRAVTGWLPADTEATPEPTPDERDASSTSPTTHAALSALQDRAAVAERAAALASLQSRAHPELRLAATRERGAFGDGYGQTVTVGVRIPFGDGRRHDARVAAAAAEATEARVLLDLERARLDTEREAARARAQAAQAQVAAAERRARLALESRGFFDKSFRLGETDLPTRLRIEAEAVEAERQAARSRIELAAAISAWRQALGLVPR